MAKAAKKAPMRGVGTIVVQNKLRPGRITQTPNGMHSVNTASIYSNHSNTTNTAIHSGRPNSTIGNSGTVSVANLTPIKNPQLQSTAIHNVKPNATVGTSGGVKPLVSRRKK